MNLRDLSVTWWPEVAALVVLPIAIAFVVPIQLYPPPGWIDPSLYLGYFLNLPVLLERFGADYHGMRLPWVLSGFIAHRVFSSTFAQLALVFGFHSLAVTSLYLIVAPRLGRFAALLSSLFLTVNPMWMAAVTRGYVDGPGLAFQLASLAPMANLPRFRTLWVPGALAGLFGGFAVHTHPVAGLFAAIAILTVLAVQQVPWRHVLQLTLWVSCSFLVATAVLDLASLHFGGPFFFPAVSLRPFTWMLDGWGLAYARPLTTWLPSAYILFPPLALLVCAIVALELRYRNAPAPALLLTGAILLGSSLAVSLLWDILAGGSALQSSFYMTFLIFGQVLIFGGLAGVTLAESERARHANSIPMLGAALLSGIAPLMMVSWLWSVEARLRESYALWILLVLLAGCSIILLRARNARVTVVLLLFATSLSGTLNADTRRIFQVDGNPSYRPFYRAAQRVNGFIRSNLEPDRRFLLWFNRDDFTAGDARTDDWLRYRMSYQGQPLILTVYDSLGALWLWHRPSVNFEMPLMGANELAMLSASVPATLSMFCPDLPRCAEGIQALERRGFSARIQAQTRIVEPAYIDITVVMLDVERSQ